MEIGVDQVDSAWALAALEQFVIENDDLLELEERIGRFNIFDALGIVRAEIRHSNFLAWLLDPNESHGQGALFLKAVLMDLLRQTPPPLRPFSPIRLDGAELRGVRVQREHRNIDILIECDEPRFVIAIENKIDSGEHSNQLERYRETIQKLFGDLPKLFVFLTREEDEPSDEAWTSYTYRDIHNVLSRVRKTNSGSIGDDVLTFLDHYLSLIGSRFMDDPKIDELCRTIYKNHRRAIDLIVERVASPNAGLLTSIEEIIREDDRWKLINKTSRVVEFIPKCWEEIFPAIGKRKFFPANVWAVLRFEVARKRAFTGMLVWPTKDIELRRRAIEQLIHEEDFGLNTFFKNKRNMSDRWTKLGRKAIAVWKEDEGPDESKVLAQIQKHLEDWDKRLARVPAVLKPIFAESAAKVGA